MGPILADLTVRDWDADSMAMAHNGDGPYVTIIRVNLEKDEYAARFAVMVRAAMEHRPDFVETTAELIGDPAAREWVSDNAVVIAHRDRQYVTLLLSTDHYAANEVAAALTTR